MAMPTKSAIYARATELYFQHEHRSGNYHANTPEYGELLESGFIVQAQSELMSNPETLYGLPRIRRPEKIARSEFTVDVEEALKSGVYVCGTSGTGKTDVAMYTAQKLIAHGVTVIAFDPSEDWKERSSLDQYTTRLDSVPSKSTVYDISQLDVVDAQKRVEDFCKLIRQHQVKTPKRLRKWHFLIFEEAHEYFSQGVMSAKKFENTRIVMTRGRNFQVRFMCITPFSSLIDKKAMKYMKQRYFGFSDEPNDIDYLEGFLGKDTAQVKTLEAGQFLYYHKGSVQPITINPFNAPKTPVYVPLVSPIAAQPVITTAPIKQRRTYDGFNSVGTAAIFLVALLIAVGAL